MNEFSSSIDPEVNHYRQIFDTYQTDVADKYYTPDEFMQNVHPNGADLTVFHFNIRSLLRKMDTLCCLIEHMGNQVDILCVCK